MPQAGAVTIRRRPQAAANGDVFDVLLVRAKKNPEHWIFPKGHIEAGESAATAAVRELREEGGVHGRAAEIVGQSDYALGAKRIRVTWFLVWFESEGIAEEDRERVWLPLAEARERLSFDDMRACLDRLLAPTSASALPPAGGHT